MSIITPVCQLSFGRAPIYSNVESVTPDNVVKVVTDALPTHENNKSEIDYLYNVYTGFQDVLKRVKTIRPEIMNNVVVNHANAIVSFKTSYLLSQPIQYVSSASAKENISDSLVRLNEYMRIQGKDGKDMELTNWLHICGVAYRIVLPDSKRANPQKSPFNVYTLDPRRTFVIRYSGIGHEPLAGVHIVHRVEAPDIVCVYTKDWYMEFEHNELATDSPSVKSVRVNYVEIPLVEYQHNQTRMGAFETVLSPLAAINTLVSNRVDAIEQYVQSLLVFENCEVQDYDEMREAGAIAIRSTNSLPAKVYAVGNEINQSGVQQAIDDLLSSVYDICGMPSTQSGGASTSDTGAAVIYRDGWAQAESRAKETEGFFKQSEYMMLANVLDIMSKLDNVSINPSDVDLSFTRRNYADLLTKSQVLTTMLQSRMIAPRLAFDSCGMFVDSEAAYNASKEYIDKAFDMADAQFQQSNTDDSSITGKPELN